MVGLKLKFKQLECLEMINQYKNLTRRYVDVDFPSEYLRRSRIIAIVYERGGQKDPIIVGGFLIAQKGPFRVLEQLPGDVVEKNNFLQNRLHRTFEVTGLWIHPLLKAGHLRCRFWFQVLCSLLYEGFKGRYYFVYSYDASKKKLGELYSAWSPRKIFEGMVYIPGMKEETHEIVELACLQSCVIAFFSNPWFFIKRFFRRSLVVRRIEAALTARQLNEFDVNEFEAEPQPVRISR